MELVLPIVFKFLKMSRTSKPALAVSQKHADASSSVLATDLIKESRFKNLRKVVKNNVDRAQIRLPIGGTNYLSLKEFQALYSSQLDEYETYLVKVPVSLINYRQGQIRLVRPEFCVQNFNLFKHEVDFCQSEFPVSFYDENLGLFDIIKKQHLTAQVAAIANVKDEDMLLPMRVTAFKSTVSSVDRDVLRSERFYNEVKGINDTKDWEKLIHQCQIGEPTATAVRDFYYSIPGLTWQPMEFPFPYVKDPQFCCTKVSEITKLIQYANNDDATGELRDIIQTLCNTLSWEREFPKKELSVYLIRAFYNFEKRLHPLIDDARGGLGLSFNILEHIETFFAKKPQKMYLGSTSLDKKPWQHLVKVADRVNEALIELNADQDTPFFSLQSSKFVDQIFALANPSMGKTKVPKVDRDLVEKYIRIHIKNFN